MDTNEPSSLLYFNIFDKNYICVSQKAYHIEPQWTSGHVYIGPQWLDVAFPKGPPLMICKDFHDFIAKVKAQHGSVKGFFDSLEFGKVKIFTETRYLGWFLLYFTNQMAQVYGWTDEMIDLYLKKASERVWIWDNQDVPLNLAVYKKYEQVIPDEDLVFSKDNLTVLPFEALLLMWSRDEMRDIGEPEMIAKILSMKDYFVNLSIRESAREAKQVALSCPQVLQQFRGHDITAHTASENIAFMNQDHVLQYIFDPEEEMDAAFVEANIDQIIQFFGLVQKYDLNKTDPGPIYDELQFINKLFFTNPEQTFAGLLAGTEKCSLFELRIFHEYAHKINSHLVAHIVVNDIETEYYANK